MHDVPDRDDHGAPVRAGGARTLPRTVNVADKLSQIDEHWSPRIVAELNDSYVKLAKVQGEFVWHRHECEDELFLVVKGRLRILLRDGEMCLGPGELTVIPRGVEHKPVADGEVHLLLLEPRTTRNTGEVVSELTAEDQWL